MVRAETLRRPAWLLGGALYGGAALVATLFVATDWGRIGAPDWLADTAFAAAPPPRALLLRPTDLSVIWRRMEPPPSATRQLPATPIQAPAQIGYEVVATFCESRAELSFAVLRDAAKRQRLVKTGDTVDGMKVVQISREGVVMLQGGAQVLLKTVEPSTGVPVAQAPAATIAARRPPFPVAAGGPAPSGPASASAAASPAPGVQPASSPPQAVAEEKDPFSLTRGELQDYVNNLPTLLSQMGMIPHLDAERKPDGLQIAGLQPQSVAAERGLRQGDIVKMIDDVAITDVAQLPPLARKILADDPAFIEIVIERDGEEESLIYEVR